MIPNENEGHIHILQFHTPMIKQISESNDFLSKSKVPAEEHYIFSF